MDNTKVVILGDFNICRSSGTNILEEHLNAYNLFSINDSPTFPVVPTEAITIHKSQGATYSKVAVHLKRGIKRASLYVGCSRATGASGLFLLGEFVPPTRFGATNV